MKREELKKIELIEEISEEVKKTAWMLRINDTDLLNLLLKIEAEGLTEEQILNYLTFRC